MLSIESKANFSQIPFKISNPDSISIAELKSQIINQVVTKIGLDLVCPATDNIKLVVPES